MRIELQDESQKLILSDEELDNNNFIDLELYDDEAKDKDNPKGYITEITVPLEELKLAVGTFWRKKMNSEKEIIDISNSFPRIPNEAKPMPLMQNKQIIPCDHNFQILPNGSSYCGICEARKLKL